MQTLTGSVVTGSGAAKLPPPQNFQSLFGIVSPTLITPSMVSRVWTVSFDPLLSVESAGKYGIGFPITLSGCPSRPLRLMIRPRIFPVTPVSTGVFT